MTRVLVCGGRDYADGEMVVAELSEAKPSVIIHGGARGADHLAHVHAVTNGIEEQVFEADWSYGRAAGPMRNQRMLDEGKPDLVIAFPGGRGTADMVRRALKGGVKVRLVRRSDGSEIAAPKGGRYHAGGGAV